MPMDDKMLKRQMDYIRSTNMLKGVQSFYQLKMGFKPPQYQVEQPSSVKLDMVPSYLQDSKKGK